MKFSDFVCFEATVPELRAGDRDGVIAELVSSLGEAGKLGKSKRKDITAEIIKRENEASTGMGKGVAMPHVKHDAVCDVVAVVGQSSAGVRFFALDKQLVYSVILMVSPVDNPDRHLQAIEIVFKHLQQEKFRRFLRMCRSSEQIRELLIEADEDPSL
ncbi:MAG: PTS sugar transporter subunit IIA [Planctomycetota bacterium]|jgi:mannitol/fructose-specific phosphotransferase system IIA component (Ntr-type)